MERELFEKAIAIDQQLYAIRKSISDIEEQGDSVFKVNVYHQNIVEPFVLKRVSDEANAKFWLFSKRKWPSWKKSSQSFEYREKVIFLKKVAQKFAQSTKVDYLCSVQRNKR